jgi:hypothetical protein
MIHLEVFEDGEVTVSADDHHLYSARRSSSGPAEKALALVLSRFTQMQLNAQRLTDDDNAHLKTPQEKASSDFAAGLASANSRIVALEATIKELHEREEKTRDAYRKEYTEVVTKGNEGLQRELACTRSNYESIKKSYVKLCESIGELAREAGYGLAEDESD